MKSLKAKWWLMLLGFMAVIAVGAETLEQGFREPPRSARPHTWYHMMNGNVTHAGITRDFEELAKVGIGGVQMFDAGCEIPPGGLDFNSPQWFEMFRHAAAEARRLGLEICIPNCSGWSSSGGPWNPPSNAMKRVVFSSTAVNGPQQFTGKLPRKTRDNGYYADIAVLAVPVPGIETRTKPLPVPRLETPLKLSSEAAKRLVDGKPSLAMNMPRNQPAAHAFTLRYDDCVSASAIELQLTGGDHWSEACNLVVEASEDGNSFSKILERKIVISQSGASDQGIRSLPFDRPHRFRALRAKFNFKPVGRGQAFFLGEFSPVNRRRLSGVAAKTFAIRQPIFEDSTKAGEDEVVPLQGVVDLTSKLCADGSLTWEVPSGSWNILRFGAICNGRCNHPASDHGKGLEVDKLSAAAMDYHFEQYVARLVAHLGPLAGAVDTGFNNILVDSFEVGSQNWTQSLPTEFRRRRGYELTPYLPVFAGYVVGGVEQSDRFLEDFRRVVADLFAENYAGALTRKCHQYGLQCSIEPYGNCPADNLQYGQYTDIPMGEFWSHAGDPYGLGCGNSKFVSYIAHVWGKKYCATESFTASPGPGAGRWMTTPFSIKAQGDSAFANGVNRIIYHRYTHQPWADDKYLPGMTMGRWGMHLDRTQTWWEFAKPWFRYQARCQYMLQKGTFRADVLFFAGEHSPNQGGNTDGGAQGGEFYKLPAGYDHDICPTDAMYALKVEDGSVVAPGGVKYRLLALPPMAACSPEMMESVIKLREAGATVVWPRKPVRAPGLKWGKDGDGRVRQLAERLWAKGIMECTPAEALVKLNLAPDFKVEANSAKDVQGIEFIHRGNAEAEWYFAAMPNHDEATAELSFRQSGRQPEIWDAESGVLAPAEVWREEGGRIYVTVPFTTCGSKFVVFRNPAAKKHWVKCELTASPRLEPQPSHNLKHTLVIKAAQYGVIDPGWKPAQDHLMDVTDKLASLVKDGKISARVNNSLFGRDPLPNVVKRLLVTYVYDGVEKQISLDENTQLVIPHNSESPVLPPNAEWRDGRLYAWQPLSARITDAEGCVKELKVDPRPAKLVEGAWEVCFPHGFLPNPLAKGAEEKVEFPALESWPDHPVKGVRYFSGTATYRKTLSAEKIAAGDRLVLDLGNVKHFAEVTVNGRTYPVLWKPPFRVDVTEAVEADRPIELSIRVANLWANRLIGDDREFEDDCVWKGVVRNGVKEIGVKEIPDWVKSGRKSPTGRCTFTTWKHWDKHDELLPSGLLGPVVLRTLSEATNRCR